MSMLLSLKKLTNWWRCRPGYKLEIDVNYPNELIKIIMDWYFYQKVEACKNKKAFTKYNGKKTHVMHIKKLNQILEDRLKTKKIHTIIRLGQKYFRP